MLGLLILRKPWNSFPLPLCFFKKWQILVGNWWEHCHWQMGNQLEFLMLVADPAPVCYVMLNIRSFANTAFPSSDLDFWSPSSRNPISWNSLDPEKLPIAGFCLKSSRHSPPPTSFSFRLFGSLGKKWTQCYRYFASESCTFLVCHKCFIIETLHLCLLATSQFAK